MSKLTYTKVEKNGIFKECLFFLIITNNFSDNTIDLKFPYHVSDYYIFSLIIVWRAATIVLRLHGVFSGQPLEEKIGIVTFKSVS